MSNSQSDILSYMKSVGKKYKFCIVTYETFPNPLTQNLKTYLLENYTVDILYIYHPQLDNKEGYELTSGYYLFKNNELVSSKNSYHFKLYWPLLYIKDVLYTLFWCLRFGEKFDVYFASGNLNPVAGLILRQIGVVKKVVYQSLDYYPVRFKNKFFNWFYFQLDKFCVRFCDETWNVSPMIAKARQKKMSMDIKVFNRQYTVPGCIWFYKVKRLPFPKINKRKIVYRGVLLPHMGIDMVLKAIPLILKKIPNLIFEIVGTGVEEKKLKKITKDLKIFKNVLFHGFVEGRENMERIISDGAIGMATFNTSLLDNNVRNSDPGKIKDYMLMGMPVITTDAFSSSNQISEKRCGIVVEYKEEQIAQAVIKLLKSDQLLREYRSNATNFIEKFDCSYILKPNLERVLGEKFKK